MAYPNPAVSSSTPQVNQSSGTHSFNHTVGAGGNKIVVAVHFGWSTLSNPITSVNWNTTETLSLITHQHDGTFEHVALYYLDSPTTGTHAVAIAYTGGSADIDIWAEAISLDDAKTGAPANSYTNTGTTANPSVTVVDSANGDLVASFSSNDVGANGDTTEGGTLIGEAEDVEADSDFSGQYQTATGASTVCSWTATATGASWVAVGVALKSSSGTITPPAGSLSFTGSSPTLAISGTLRPDSGAVSLTGYKPSVWNQVKQPPSVLAANATGTTIGTASDPWAINVPNASTGDLLLFSIAWDDSTNVTTVTAPSGQNGETITSIIGPVASASTEMRMQAWYTVCTGAWTAGTISFDPSAAETCRAVVTRVPADTFDSVNPIGASSSSASAATTESNLNSPAFTAGATDGSGRLVIDYGSDTDAITAPASGTTTVDNTTAGAVGHCIVTRDAVVSNSESIASVTATIASDSWACLAYIVRARIPDLAYEPAYGQMVLGGTSPDLTFSGGVTITPASGSVVLTGSIPTSVGGNVTIQPGAGSTVLTGSAPTVSIAAGDITITPAAGSLTITGSLPDQTYTLSPPGSASIVLTGFAPTINAVDQTITPASGSVVLTGSLPSVGLTYSISPDAGSVVLTGSAPTVSAGASITITPDSGSVVLTGSLPGVGQTYSVTPDSGVLSLTGSAPTVETGANQSITPGAGSVVLTGSLPGVGQTYSIGPASGAVVLTASVPNVTVTQAGTIVPLFGSLVLTATSPIVGGSVTISPDSGSVTISGFAPTAGFSYLILPANGSVSLVSSSPLLDLTMTPASASVVLGGYAPVLDFALYPSPASLVLTTTIPIVGGNEVVSVPAGQIVVTGYQPRVFPPDTYGTPWLSYQQFDSRKRIGAKVQQQIVSARIGSTVSRRRRL